MHRVKEFRVKYGWNQNELAERAGISARLVSLIEKSPDYDCQRGTMINISNAFNLPPSVIFFPEEETEKRKMLAAIVSVCMQYVDESDIYNTLPKIKSHRIEILSLQDDGPKDTEPSLEQQSSSEGQP